MRCPTGNGAVCRCPRRACWSPSPLFLVRSVLVTVGMIAAVPLGVLPLLVILLRVGDSPPLWFLPLLLPSEWQALAVLGFLASGGLRVPRWLGPRLLC